MDRVQGPNLTNLSSGDLQGRLDALDRNIQYLDSGCTPRDALPPERGWLSPWWWLRARHWTLLEFKRREIAIGPTPLIPEMPALVRDFVGVVAGGRRLLVRISEEKWLLETLREGRIKFGDASSYRDATLGTARADDELKKSYLRPSQGITITTPNGSSLKAIGDVEFSNVRAVEKSGHLIQRPYWMCSFSSDLDPRLFEEFGKEGTPSDACLVIFDPDEFMRRATPKLNRAAPRATKSLFPTEYFDSHFAPFKRPSALISKHYSYAYQREMRLVLDPEGGPSLASGDLFVEVGSIADIAAVYSRDGKRIAGSGPATFLA